jgi:adenine-specific DNA-methyltransferase
MLTRAQLQQISDEVGDKRSLLICCGAFRVKADTFPNLTLKKIPKAVLHKCEWGHDDYSLEIKNLPAAPDMLPLAAELDTAVGRSAARRRQGAPSLFDAEGGK